MQRPGSAAAPDHDSGSLAASEAWLAPLCGLRELSLTASHDSLHIWHSLEHHSQLTALRLRGLSIQLGDGVQLPPSVVRLEIQDQETLALPDQVGAACLPQLPSCP